MVPGRQAALESALADKPPNQQGSKLFAGAALCGGRQGQGLSLAAICGTC